MILRTYTTEPTAIVSVRELSDGRMVLVAVDSDGLLYDGGKLLYLLPDGTLERIEGVNPDLGFALDPEGRIKLSGEA